mgnify:CR=1 FL=1
MNQDNREYQQRRKELMAQMEPNSIALIAAAPARTRSNDTEYYYRQNSDFYYLTGFDEQDALLALIPGRKQGEVVLFCQEKDKVKELWTGVLMGPEAALSALSLDDAFPIADIDDILPGLIEGRERVYYSMGHDSRFDERVMDWVKVIRAKAKLGAQPPGEFLVLDHLLHELRLIKSKHEIELMQRAAEISAEGHRQAMAVCAPGVHEFTLEAELNYAFTRGGSRAPAYNSIVAAGENACILHYDRNDAEVKDGDLILIDAGCEYKYYASDITRTFPANGRFTATQRADYELVLAAQAAAEATLKAGVSYDAFEDAAKQVFRRAGRIDDFIHGLGHYVGLDVHDPFDRSRPIPAGAVITIEPGLYTQSANQGIRIEDQYLVTAAGSERMSAGIPRSIAEIEAAMRG